MLNTGKHNVWITGPVSGFRRETPALLGPLERKWSTDRGYLFPRDPTDHVSPLLS
jgi:hypothetical protein